MKFITVSFSLFFCIQLSGQTTWKQSLHYQIQVKFNDTSKALDAVMHLRYTNHSPDTLGFIWFHLWPNAFRNDRTAYTDQELQNGKTGFYFSKATQKGYINRLSFRVDGVLATTQDDSDYIDVIRLNLPRKLSPGDSIQIETGFHVRIPYDFSGTGYQNHHFEIRNWYPEPAVFDASGWHKMPFLEQGGAYHECADYDVDLESPSSYRIVSGAFEESVKTANNTSLHKLSIKNANSFAWIADKKYQQKTDTVKLNNGQIINIQYEYFQDPFTRSNDIISGTKKYLRQLSDWLIDYPHRTITIVPSAPPSDQSFTGLIFIGSAIWPEEIDAALRRELSSQWFQTILLTDQRNIPWFSKGFIRYYNERLLKQFPSSKHQRTPYPSDELWLRVAEKVKKIQPISTPSQSFSIGNDSTVAYTQAGIFINTLSQRLGEQKFDSLMSDYYHQWSYCHPYPHDFESMLDSVSKEKFDSSFDSLNTNRYYFESKSTRKIKAAYLFSAKETSKYNYIGLAPIVGYNRYDDIMLGMLVHNINLPPNNFEFLLTPLYAFGSKTLEGLGRLSYSLCPDGKLSKITFGVNGGRFSSNKSSDSLGKTIFENFSKIVPYIRIDFKENNPRSTLKKWIDFKSYLITEKSFDQFAFSSKDSLIHPNGTTTDFRYVNQLSLNIADERVLYPYNVRLELQQSDLIYRINLSANYLLNYPDGGGLQVRFYASKFGVWNNNNNIDLTRYEPKLLGVTGQEDYLYDAYFVGRSVSSAYESAAVPNTGLEGQQIMNRDGGLKLRADQYQYVQGRSANWVSSLNFNTSLPTHLFPVPIPIKIFFDIGTYAEAWQNNPPKNRFLYTGGLQLSLFKNVLNIYAPLIYSSDFKDAMNSMNFGKRLTFSIDIKNIRYDKLLKKKVPIYE